MKEFLKLQKLNRGDQVGVISPSAGLPGLFPWVQDLGLERLQNIFGLVPKEYPTTRQMNSPLEDRARDIMEAFKDPGNKAVIASIGGDDQIKLLKYLDPQVFLDNPKSFFGYSDNTHLINFLWNLGIPSYYGGMVLTQYAMQIAMHDFTADYLKKALFEGGEVELNASEEFNDEGLNWADKENMNKQRRMEANDGWFWDCSKEAEGFLWGGCIESLYEEMAVGKYLPKDEDLEDAVLFLESAEDIPEPWIVDYLLVGMGERGWFDKFQAVLVGRPKAWEFDKQKTPEQKTTYRKEQRKTVIKAVREYNKDIPIVQNLDFGHTDPQFPVPAGHKVRIVSTEQKIFVEY